MVTLPSLLSYTKQAFYLHSGIGGAAKVPLVDICGRISWTSTSLRIIFLRRIVLGGSDAQPIHLFGFQADAAAQGPCQQPRARIQAGNTVQGFNPVFNFQCAIATL